MSNLDGALDKGMMPDRIDSDNVQLVRLTLADQAADKLRNWILIGELAPGEFLVERTLSERLGVSRTPMREALLHLGNEGLVVIVPNRRPRVANPSRSEILALLEVHSLLEAHGTMLAAESITELELERLKHLIDEMEQTSAKRGEFAFFDLDMAFHRSIMEASRNAPLIETHAQLNARIYRARFLSTQTISGRPLMLSQHHQIYDALRRGDGEAAKTHLEEHLHQLSRNITANFSDHSEQDQTTPAPAKRNPK
ncbi:MAG: GntR family transcriptional regulator [Pseudomonadota bacterium]